MHAPPSASLTAAHTAWVEALVACHQAHARTRMAGLPICHPGLTVEAVGFQPWEGTPGQSQGQPQRDPGLLGVLITPWFMSLVWRADGAPLADDAGTHDRLGMTRILRIGGQALPFIGASDPMLGGHATCSLYSPMFAFADQAAASATAHEVMVHLRDMARDAAAQTPTQPARRGFLLGRLDRATAGTSPGAPT